MNIGEEKTFIYGMMKDITEERRKLSDQYFSLKLRLDDLIKLEEKGIEKLSTTGFIDLFNDRETHIQITNVNREVKHAVEEKSMAMERNRAAQTLQDDRADQEERARLREVYRAEAEAAMREAAATELTLEEENHAKQSTTLPVQMSIIPQMEIDLAKEREAKNDIKRSATSVVRKAKGNKFTDMQDTIVEILKKNGGPVKANLIFYRLNETLDNPITLKRFSSNIMYRAKNHENIESVGHGLYQYKPAT
jgi:hypothetical protein